MNFKCLVIQKYNFLVSRYVTNCVFKGTVDDILSQNFVKIYLKLYANAQGKLIET